ncbi:hypothetical protein LTR37_018840 [Vermiconidia calcicola]|uniref:Uncharacterized protein n=1 Tax=Vermiconidia calcicola TaxID=1690605 RepID=A0ACC3MHL5_9PEZI|nr:hypothetical protein LTR37_018840 [Vermiconidia calcicola]
MPRRERDRKRSRDDYDADNRLGMGQTVAHLKGSTQGSDEDGDQLESKHKSHTDELDGSGEWQRAESHSSKKRKKNNYPSISHSSQNRLQTFVKLGDLQNLVLYLLADGPSPQWCAVRHHTGVRKVVALMVPGLEAGMFDGSIPLSVPEQEQEKAIAGTTTADSSELAEKPSNASDLRNASEDSSYQTVKYRKPQAHPDDYYPNKLKHDRLPAPLKPVSDMFEHIWPIKTPGDDKFAKMHSPMAAMLISPIVKTREEKKGKGPKPPPDSRIWKNERTVITEFIATTAELAEEGYVLHPAHYNGTSFAVEETAKRESNNQTTADGWVDTPDVSSLDSGVVIDKDIEKGSLLAGRKILAMDCEMCITSPPGTAPAVFSLTRISIIDWDGQVVMDEFVKPEQPITDYLTPYSGITPAKLENVTTTLQDIQKQLTSDLLTQYTILVGHSLNADLNALRLTHPFIIDTALLFPHPRGPPLKSSLKWLAQKYLSREIQKGHGSTGHDSIEDAKACLDLVKQKCEKGKAWGTSEASGESIFKRLGKYNRPKRDKVNQVGDDEPRVGAVVDWGEPARGYGAQAKVTIGCESDDQVVAGIKRAIEGDNDESKVPRGGVDFVFARLRELEAHRGWWNRSKTLDNDALRNNTASNNDSTSDEDVVAQIVAHIKRIYEDLPPCTALIVFSGSGDPRDLAEMQSMQQKYKEEFRVKKWDELSVKWTDDEEQKLRWACDKARKGIGFVTVK